MGELAAIQLDNAIDALGKRDSCVAQRIVDNDDALDDQERRISQDVLRLLALRQPMARDLREVLAALRVASDIERIGDHATNIAENIWFVVHGVAMPKTQENIDMTDKTPSRDQGVNDTA